MTLALLPRHVGVLSLEVAREVGAAAHLLRRAGHAEMAALVEEAWALWERVEAAGGALATVRGPLRDAVLRLAAVGRHFADDGVGRHLPDVVLLGERLASLDARIARCRDPGTRRELDDVRRSIEAQLQHCTSIAARAERVEARMHGYVAAMEALRLAALDLRSADAAAHATALRPMLESLARLGEDVDLSRAAVEEAHAEERLLP
jgi:hypothetical protein